MMSSSNDVQAASSAPARGEEEKEQEPRVDVPEGEAKADSVQAGIQPPVLIAAGK